MSWHTNYHFRSNIYEYQKKLSTSSRSNSSTNRIADVAAINSEKADEATGAAAGGVGDAAGLEGEVVARDIRSICA